MHNLMNTVMNAQMFVIFVVACINIRVKCVLRHSVNPADSYDIIAYILVSALIHVMFVISHSENRAI
jgi:hypothetical protein